MDQPGKRIDPVYYIAQASPSVAKALAIKHGLTCGDNLQEIFNCLKIIEATPAGKREIYAIHPDAQMIALPTAPIPQRAISSYTADELASMKAEYCGLGLDELKARRENFINVMKWARFNSEGKANMQQQVDIIDSCIVAMTSEGGASGNGNIPGTNIPVPQLPSSLSKMDSTKLLTYAMLGIVTILVIKGLVQ